MNGCRGIVIANGDTRLRNHRAGIKAGFHLHKRYSRLRIPRKNSLLNRRCAAVTRQKRSMEINRAARR